MEGDTRKIYNLVNMLSTKPKQPPANLTRDSTGKLFHDPKEVANAWGNFLKEKFSTTHAETQRPDLPPLPKVHDPITRKEFNTAVKQLKTGKALGPDGVPATVYKFCPKINNELFHLLRYMWEEEVVPTSMATAKFKMLFKHKGSSDDPSKYRCIALLNHAYKILSYILLGRLVDPTSKFLQDWQAGFRKERGCRDNIMILRVLCEKVMAMGEKLSAVFIDYKAVFDSVSHKFIDEALGEARVPTKVRAMFRAIYKAAAAFTTTPGPDGKQIPSEHFDINRGVLQGDVTSPLFFILALELILRRYDNNARADKGIPLAEVMVHLLGYADDVAVVDSGSPEGIQRLETRVTDISRGSREDADMQLSTDKTKALHVMIQDPVSPTTAEEATNQCKFTCPHLNCNFKFMTKSGLRIHMSRCEWRDEFEVERIVQHRGAVVSRQYKVRWKNFDATYDTWEPRNNLHPKTIKDYEVVNGSYDYTWQHRCTICDLPCSSTRVIKIHQARVHKDEKTQNFKGSLADNAVKMCKLVQQQESRPAIKCEGVT